MIHHHINARRLRCLVVYIIIHRIVAGHDDRERPRLVAAILVAAACIDILERMGEHYLYLLHIGISEVGPHGIGINSEAVQVGIILLVVDTGKVTEYHLVGRVDRYEGRIAVRHLRCRGLVRRLGTMVIAMARGQYCRSGNKQTDLFHW